MELYKFARANGSRVALSSKKDGSNLPKGGVPWQFIGKVDLKLSDKPRIGADDVEAILAAIEANGIYLSGE